MNTKDWLTISTVGLLMIAGVFIFLNPVAWFFQPRNAHEPLATTTIHAGNQKELASTTQPQRIQTVAGDLSVPWGLSFLPNGSILLTERTGQLLELTQDGKRIHKTEIASVKPTGEGGLLGAAIHPNFNSNYWVYLYETYQDQSGTRNRVVRYRYQDGTLSDQEIIIGRIPGASYHDGGRIAFGPNDEYLYITTGDAGKDRQAQDPDTLNGNILRVRDDGSIPADNPFGNAVFSNGHRNPQGLAWDQAGRLWSAEHGRSGVRSGLDELNLIEKGSNYGWPYLEGDETCDNSSIYSPPVPESEQSDCQMLSPMTHSGPEITWAPASLAIHNGHLIWSGLRGQAIYTAPIRSGGSELLTGDVQAYFKEKFGRVRTVAVGPDAEYLYVTTSNTDGRGSPESGDDKLIRVPLNRF